jgi:hypothetical protein
MAHCKTTTCKKVTRVKSKRHREIDWMLERPSESHDDGRTSGYFPRELRSLLRTLDYHDERSTTARRPHCATRATSGRCMWSSMRSPEALKSAVFAWCTMPLH